MLFSRCKEALLWLPCFFLLPDISGERAKFSPIHPSAIGVHAGTPRWGPEPFVMQDGKVSSDFQLCLICSVTSLQKVELLPPRVPGIHSVPCSTMTQSPSSAFMHLVKSMLHYKKSPHSKVVAILDISLKQTAMHAEQCSESCWGFSNLIMLYSF